MHGWSPTIARLYLVVHEVHENMGKHCANFGLESRNHQQLARNPPNAEHHLPKLDHVQKWKTCVVLDTLRKPSC